MRLKHIFVLIVCLIISFTFIYLDKKQNSIYHLVLNNEKINILISDSVESRMKGLGDRNKLDPNTIMLFVFDKPDVYSIWMKNMYFPLDIIWLDEELNIIHIEEDISPNTYPKIYSSNSKSLYVIEANSGFSKRFDLKVGNKINIEK